MRTGNATDSVKIPVLHSLRIHRKRKFFALLWTTLSIESAGLSIEIAPFYRMAGFLGIPRKRKFLESVEHIIL